MWTVILQDTTARAIKMSPSMAPRSAEAGGRVATDDGGSQGGGGCEVEVVEDAMSLILAVPGNSSCADCNSRSKGQADCGSYYSTRIENTITIPAIFTQN